MPKKPSKRPEKYVLELPVDYKYFDMIVYEGKREEYRDIKPYWEKRLMDYKAIKRDYQALLTIAFLFFRFPPVDVCKEYPRGYTHVRFRRGYSKVYVGLSRSKKTHLGALSEFVQGISKAADIFHGLHRWPVRDLSPLRMRLVKTKIVN